MKTSTTSRRQFIKGGGYLLISFSLLPAPTPSLAAERRGRGGGGNMSLDAWIRINADGTVTVFTGKMELGQGIRTALAQIAAEELDLPMSRIRMHVADTGATPNEGYTAGSMSIETSGMSIRRAAAEARQVLIELAAKQLGIPADQLRASDGKITAGEKSTTYWDLLGGKRIERQSTGRAPIKKPEDHKLVGKPVPRIEIPDLAVGKPFFVQDLRLPGMLHARVLRPPCYSAKLQSIPEAEVAAMEGVVKLYRSGSYVAVIAKREEQAIAALERLRARAVWTGADTTPDMKTAYAQFKKSSTRQDRVKETGNVDQALQSATKRVEAQYLRPYHMHASLGPSCAVAHLKDGEMTIWSHTQGAYPLRDSIARLIGMDASKVRVIGTPGAGCYGHNGADDVGADAAILAVAMPGTPIRVQWMRYDEHMWEPYGSMMMYEMRGGLDAAGRITAWESHLFSDGHGSRPGGNPAALMPAWYMANPQGGRRSGFIGGGTRNFEPQYDLPNQRLIAHPCSGPLRTSSMRGLGAYGNIYAIESFMDELALAAGADPVEFRLKHMKDPRGRAVIEAAAKAIGWGRKLPPGRGLGIGYAQYKGYATYLACCVEAEVTADEIRILRMVGAADSGQIINPDGLKNQLEGGMVQSASWTLSEEVKFDRTGVTSKDWRSYPILRFTDVPAPEIVLIDRPNERSVGAGEGTQGQAGAAVANAVAKAAGKRVRDLPITIEKLKALG